MIGLSINVESFIYVYLFASIAMIFFNAFCILQRKGSNKILILRSQKLKKILKPEISKLKKGKHISETHQDYLINKLNKVSYLMAFNSIIINYPDKEIINKYLKELKIVFTTLAQKYREKNNTQKAYFAYLVGHYRINTPKDNNFINDFMIESLLSNSTYLRENSLKALYFFGNSECVLNALDLLNRNDINHNPKLITDGLLTFSGDIEILSKLLYNNFTNFKDELKIAIINYFGFVSARYQKKFADMLKSNKETKEVNLALIRYFRKHPYKECEKFLIAYLTNYNERNWEYTAVAANALSSYKSKYSKNALINAISNPNWHVRSNVADSLLSIGISDKEIDAIINSNDLYAKEILEYKLNRKEQYHA